MKKQALLIIQNQNRYHLHSYRTERELEDIAKNYAKEMFGEKAIYIDVKKKISSAKGIAGIPDGFILDFDHNKFYIVEVELSSHDIIRHISEQLIRFKIAMNNPKTKEQLSETFFKEANRFNSKIKQSDIDTLFNTDYGIAIIIDNVSEKLLELVNILSADGKEVITIPFESYKDVNENFIYRFSSFSKAALEKEAKKWTFKWADVPVGHHTENIEAKLQSVFDNLRTEICSLNGVNEKSRKNWITYQTSPLKNFCTIKLLPESLEIHLKCNEFFIDEKGVCRKLQRTPAWTFDRVFNIANENEVKYAMQLIRQAHDCICGK